MGLSLFSDKILTNFDGIYRPCAPCSINKPNKIGQSACKLLKINFKF